MTTFEAGEFTLHKVRDHVWEMPPEDGMRVPARVFASEALLEEIADDLSLQQLRNTTHLPGVRKYAVCMPDGHQGYGFPVGGVAGIDAEDGCISPGAVGYDINCLPGDTSVRLSFGRRRPLEDLRETFESERAMVPTTDDLVASPIRLFTESGSETVTTSGGEVTCRVTIETDFDREERLPKHLALCIDSSTSMEGSKMRDAREGAKEAVDVLSDRDYISVVDFNSDVVRVVDQVLTAVLCN